MIHIPKDFLNGISEEDLDNEPTVIGPPMTEEDLERLLEDLDSEEE